MSASTLATSGASQLEMEQKFKRDLNRVSDTDRTTRKRGLQKLLEDLPWSSHSDKQTLSAFCNSHVIDPVSICVKDSVEKCRELALEIIKKMLEADVVNLHVNGAKIVHTLCNRIADLPFPENTEELRLAIVEILLLLLKSVKKTTDVTFVDATVADTIVKATGKILHDNFPAVKKAAAELLQFVAKNWPESIRMSFSLLLKPLAANVLHQHNKTRSATLKALGLCLVCMEDGYDIAMKDPILPLLGRVAADRAASTRRELAILCRVVLKKRVKRAGQVGADFADADNNLIVLMLLLMKDENVDVSVAANEGLQGVASIWNKYKVSQSSDIVKTPGDEICDGELAMQIAEANTEAVFTTLKVVDDDIAEVEALDSQPVDSNNNNNIKSLLQFQLRNIAVLLLNGVEGWTSDARLRYLGGLQMFVEIAQESCVDLLPIILHGLGVVIRDEEVTVREAAQECTRALARFVNSKALFELLLPRARGQTAGGDTASHRVIAIRLLTHLVVGIADRLNSSLQITNSSHTETAMAIVEDADDVEIAFMIADIVGCSNLHEFREIYLREAIVLLIRNTMLSFPVACVQNEGIQREILRGLLYLKGRCPGESDVIPAAATNESFRLAVIDKLVWDSSPILLSSPPPTTATTLNLVSSVGATIVDTSQQFHLVSSLLGKHFVGLLTAFCPGFENPNWNPGSPAKAGFEELVKGCNLHAWKQHDHVIAIVSAQVQPKKAPAEGTPEQISQSYAAQRGEESVAQLGEVDVRLSLLALLEGMIREGTVNWECSTFIAASCERIIRTIVVPNLIWKVGRVEATVRKVALAACYGLLKAGAARPEALYKSAGELVPLVASHLDDSDVSPRLMSCFCLTVIFERLRGAFGEQALLEIYPKLLKRLDDSNDDVRIAVCATLVMFLQCGATTACYRGTMIDYTLDQLFIHLDDPDENIQENIEIVIIQASKIDKDLVEKKAERNRTTHRTPMMCDRILAEVRGFEILE